MAQPTNQNDPEMPVYNIQDAYPTQMMASEAYLANAVDHQPTYQII